VPAAVHVEQSKDGWVFVLEDLVASGFDGRSHSLDAALRWLAGFHAAFLGERPRGLWKTGTYWHLATRPDEHRSMAAGPLRNAAGEIDARLRAAAHQTLVHGDAKPSNFCTASDGRRVAAVDFQYVGRGPGIKDVAYLLAGEDRSTSERCLALYFNALRGALDAAGCTEGDGVVAEWRGLYPWAWADFQRFLAGWAPNWSLQAHELALTRGVLRSL
jgi:aminoglycoside phosphotransferase (APT) family kinase protein